MTEVHPNLVKYAETVNLMQQPSDSFYIGEGQLPQHIWEQAYDHIKYNYGEDSTKGKLWWDNMCVNCLEVTPLASITTFSRRYRYDFKENEYYYCTKFDCLMVQARNTTVMRYLKK